LSVGEEAGVYQNLALKPGFCSFQGIKGPKGLVDLTVGEEF
jgi:hypothetical protein